MLFSRGLASSMSENRHTAVVTVGFGQGSKVDSVPMGSRMTHIPEAPAGQRGPGKPQSSGPRRGRLMHQSTLSLGDPQGSGTSYTTTHTQSYCGREADGQPLVFFPRDPAYPSQHTSQLDLSHTSTSQSQTHSRDIHNHKDIIPFNVLHRLGQSNWSRNRDGVAMREVTIRRSPPPTGRPIAVSTGVLAPLPHHTPLVDPHCGINMIY
ncbi:uncharacterized protein [Salvelinus sp. IW2-2015]|uniref:uncharacterized protein n=1 Tax=Salvelinus sp. IW2-2015 TaxID=2691554 RepID=UPI000CEA7C81|nr:uncharacterized protein LOC112073041 [Salvelinus alpinus]